MTDSTPTGPDVIVVDDVSKSFVLRKDNSLKERIVTLGRRGRQHREEFQSLKNVRVSIPAGSSIALMGPNGSGKSTLLKVIGGIIDPSSGMVYRRGRLAALLELGAGFHPDLSGRDNVYLNASVLGLTREETDARFESIVEFAEIGEFIDTQVKFYSSGMYVRLAFAVAIHTDPDILLVDEVLAVGDEAFQRKCMDKIRQFQREGRTIVLVSHSAAQVMDICDQGVVLHHGEVAFIGDAAEATKVHREIMEGKRQAGLDSDAEEPKPQRARIVGMRLVTPEGDPVQTMEPGGDVVVEVEVEHLEAADAWNSSISIDTPQGQQVFGTGTRRLSSPHRAATPGRSVVRYLLPELRLAGGQYFVNAEVADAVGAPVDVRWQGVSFFVPVDTRQAGTVYVEASVSEA